MLEYWFFISVPSVRFDSANVYEQTHIYLKQVIYQTAVSFNFVRF
jgi:hypothetical protein